MYIQTCIIKNILIDLYQELVLSEYIHAKTVFLITRIPTHFQNIKMFTSIYVQLDKYS